MQGGQVDRDAHLADDDGLAVERVRLHAHLSCMQHAERRKEDLIDTVRKRLLRNCSEV